MAVVQRRSPVAERGWRVNRSMERQPSNLHDQHRPVRRCLGNVNDVFADRQNASVRRNVAVNLTRPRMWPGRCAASTQRRGAIYATWGPRPVRVRRPHRVVRRGGNGQQLGRLHRRRSRWRTTRGPGPSAGSPRPARLRCQQRRQRQPDQTGVGGGHRRTRSPAAENRRTASPTRVWRCRSSAPVTCRCSTGPRRVGGN